jgi:hypothetical protein
VTDPGLAPQRTALAWSRTALAFAGVAALLLRDALVRGDPVSLTGAVLAAAGTLLVARTALVRRHELTAGRAAGAAQSGRLATVSAGLAAVGVVAVAVVAERAG